MVFIVSLLCLYSIKSINEVSSSSSLLVRVQVVKTFASNFACFASPVVGGGEQSESGFVRPQKRADKRQGFAGQTGRGGAQVRGEKSLLLISPAIGLTGWCPIHV